MITDPAKVKELADIAVEILEENGRIARGEAVVFTELEVLALHARGNSADAVTAIMRDAHITVYGAMGDEQVSASGQLAMSAALDTIKPDERKTLASLYRAVSSAAKTYIAEHS